MGKYLNFETALERLLREYEEHGCIVVAYDFDDTVCTYTPGNPEPTLERRANEEICQLLRELRPYAKFVVWTCRSTDPNVWEPGSGSRSALELALQWLRNHNVPFDHVNEDTVVSYGSRKIYANIFLDDRAGLSATFLMLKMFLQVVKNMKTFNPNNARAAIVQAIKDYFHDNGKDSRAILGVSGGADSTIVAGLCVEALGASRVLGVIMPNGEQSDIQDAIDVCNELGIQYLIINIQDQVRQMCEDLGYKYFVFAPEMLQNNLPNLVRRNVLASIKLTSGGRVMNTTNQSEEFLGWITQGDNIVGDFAPLINYTKTEAIKIGLTLPISERFIVKVPHDGMCGSTDEEKFGFTYEQVDWLIGAVPENNPVFLGIDQDEMNRIVHMHQVSQFKRNPLACAPHVN